MFPPFLTVLRPNANNTMTVPTDVPLKDVLMHEAIIWMNAPTNVLERFDRKYALLTYLNASINLAAIKETKPGEGG